MLNISTHWYNLKLRIIYSGYSFLLSLVTFYINGDIILWFFVKPFLIQNSNKTFIFTSLLEGFLSFIVISVFCSILITLPLIVYLLFNFYKYGFIKKEKKLCFLLIRLMLVLVLFSFAVAHCIFLPTAMKFFLSFEQTNIYSSFQLYLQPKILDYVVLNVIFSIGLIFLFVIPISISFLLSFKFIPITYICKNRRTIIVFCFILGCICSPPDLLFQIVIATPLCIIIESMVCYQFILNKYNTTIKRKVARMVRGKFAKLKPA
jgi:sec-independent protein translocase protein TatC